MIRLRAFHLTECSEWFLIELHEFDLRRASTQVSFVRFNWVCAGHSTACAIELLRIFHQSAGTGTRSTSMHDISPTQVICLIVKIGAPPRMCRNIGAWGTLEPVDDMAKDLPIMFWSSRNEISIGIIHAQANFKPSMPVCIFLSWNFFSFRAFGRQKWFFQRNSMVSGNSFYCSRIQPNPVSFVRTE